MKKLLVLVVILALAPMASALLQISVNGVQNTEFGTINLLPSDTLELDIWNDAVLDTINTPITLALISPSACAAISGGVINENITNASIFMMNLSDVPQAVGEGMGGIWGGVTVFSGTVAAGSTLVSQIAFHCEAPNGLTTVSLIKIDDMTGEPTGVVYDTLVINQIPEPATIALLSLGGLLLRKKS